MAVRCVSDPSECVAVSWRRVHCWLIVYASPAHFVEVVHVLRTQMPFLGFDRHQLDGARELERWFVGWSMVSLNRLTSGRAISSSLGWLRIQRCKILDRSARYSEIACSRLNPEFSRIRACRALIRSSASPRTSLPLLFSNCSVELCGLSMLSAIANKISRKWSRSAH